LNERINFETYVVQHRTAEADDGNVCFKKTAAGLMAIHGTRG